MNALLEEKRVGSGRWTDEDLLLEYRMTGNRELFEVLVSRYESELFRFLYKKTGNKEIAEDVFQLTFLQVHLKSALFEEGRRFRPWLYRIAMNQAIDYNRMNKRHQNISLDETIAGYDEEGDSLVATLESDEARPSESIEKAEEIAFVREAVRHLPEAHRVVLERVYFRGMTYREAADELGIPLKTVASRVNSARKRLAAALSVRMSQKM